MIPRLQLSRRIARGIGVVALIALVQPAAYPADVESRALLEQAEVLQRAGHRHRAVEYLERARVRAEASGDSDLLPAIEGALGKAYLLRGRADEARILLTRALQSAESTGRRALAAAVLNDLGNLAVINAVPAEAAQLYERSLRIALELGAHPQAATTAANIVRLRFQQSQTAGALDALRDLERETKLIDEPRPKVAALLASAELFERAHEIAHERSFLQRAYAAYEEVASLGQQTHDLRAVSLARGGLARLYLLEGRYEEAGELAALALAAAQPSNAADLFYRWHWVTASALAGAGKPEAALPAYRRAISSFQPVRLDLIQELSASGKSYRDAVGPLFLELADVLLRRAKANGGAQPDLIEARDVIEQFRSVELEDYFQDECVARMQARKRAIEEIAADTAVLYPIFLKDRTEILLSIAGTIRQYSIGTDAARLTAELHEFRRKLEKRTTHEYLPHAQRLYDWLFAPLEPQLREHGITTIVLIPDGPMRGVPMAALHDGKEFVVTRYAFAVAPGLTLLEPRPLSTGAQRVLLSGLSDSVQQFPALPFVVTEMAEIERVTNAKTLHNADFRVPAFEQELRSSPYSVVHIASHGQFDSDRKKTFLLTFDSKITIDNLEQYMKLARYRDAPIELLTLSACRTAAGDDRAALGLAGIAIKAGARSALATLWFINDQASSELVSNFYEILRTPDASKVSALQLAQQRMLADAKYRHPSYWAPFLLIGNWL